METQTEPTLADQSLCATDILENASHELRELLRVCLSSDVARRSAVESALAEFLRLNRYEPQAVPNDPQRLGDVLIAHIGDRLTGDRQRRYWALNCRAAFLRLAARVVCHDWPLATRPGGQRMQLGPARLAVLAFVDSRLVLRLTWAESRCLLAESMPGHLAVLNPAVDPE
jgi:hypothetical protein